MMKAGLNCQNVSVNFKIRSYHYFYSSVLPDDLKFLYQVSLNR